MIVAYQVELERRTGHIDPEPTRVILAITTVFQGLLRVFIGIEPHHEGVRLAPKKIDEGCLRLLGRKYLRVNRYLCIRGVIGRIVPVTKRKSAYPHTEQCENEESCPHDLISTKPLPFYRRHMHVALGACAGEDAGEVDCRLYPLVVKLCLATSR